MANRSNLRVATSVAVSLVVTCVAVLAVRRIAAETSLADVTAAIARVNPGKATLAALATIASYLALSGYDVVALRAVGRPLPWTTAVRGSTSAYALSHNLGFAPITATWARHRVYGEHGVGLSDALRIVALAGASFWIGVLLVLGASLVAVPGIEQAMPMTPEWRIAIGLIVIDVVVLYLLAISRGAKRLGRGSWSIPLPSLGAAFAQAAISLAEMALAALVLWALIPDAAVSLYPLVLAAYVAAFVAVLASHAPGGIGVLEAVMLTLLPMVPRADLLGALILFRVLFHLLPLAAAAVILAKTRRA